MKTERRAFARYQAKLEVQIDMDDYRFDATSMDVSLQGLRIFCEGPTASNIFNRYIQVTPGENVTVDIQIKVPNHNGLTDALKCQAKVIFVSRASQSSYVVGFNIIEFYENDQDTWLVYISNKH